MPKAVKRVVKNSFFQTFGAFGISALNFVLLFGYAQTLSPEEYGALATSQSRVILWTMLVDLGFSHSLIGALTAAEGGRSEAGRQGFRARDLVFRVLLLRLFGAGIGALSIYLLARSETGTPLQGLDLAFTPYLFALAFQQTASAFATYRHRQGLAVVANFGSVALSVVLALLLASAGAGLPWLLLAQSWAGFLAGSVVFGYFGWQALVRRRQGESRRLARQRRGPWRRASWLALARDAWPYAISFAVTVAWQRLDQLVASRTLGLEAGGQYALAVRLVALPILAAASVSFAMFPDLQRVGRDSPARVQVILGLCSKLVWRYGILIVAAVLVGLGLLMWPLVPRYRPALLLLPYFVPGVWAFWIQSFLMNALFGLRRYRLIVAAQAAALCLYVPSLFLLTPAYGLHGVVWAFNIFCLSTALFAYLAAQRAGLLPNKFLPFGALTAPERSLWRQVTGRSGGAA